MAVNWQRGIMRAIGAREQPVTVTAVEDVLPWYRRVHFSAPAFLAGLDLFPTIWVRLWVPSIEDPALLRQRGYTLVDPDPAAGTFALEFVLHEPVGAASHWAQHVRPGDTAEIAFTPARIDPDAEVDAVVAVGDSSAIPAVNSLLDHLPPDTPVDVVLADRHDDLDRLLRLRPLTRLHVVTDVEAQLRTLRSLPVTAHRYGWAAGERRAVAAARQVFRQEWRLPKHRQHTQYYWIEGKPFG